MNLSNIPSKVKNTSEPLGQARLTGPPKVANNLDKLKVSFWINWRDTSFLDELSNIKDSLQQTANTQEKPYTCPGEFNWNVHRTGTKLFRYRLTSGDISFLINHRSPDDSIPNVCVDIGSESCWTPGYKTIYERFIKWLSALGGDIVKNQISEVHMAADFIGLSINSLKLEDKAYWITKSKKFTTVGTHKHLETFSIGKGELMLRIYDKISELKNNTSKFFTFYEIWEPKHLLKHGVTRVEFQIRRGILKNIKSSSNSDSGIDTYDDLHQSMNSIWKHCTSKWSRHCSSVVDMENKHQSRASNSKFWNSVCNVKWEGSYTCTKQRPKPKKDYLLLRKQFLGLGMSLVAFHQTQNDDLDHIIDIGKSIFEEDVISFYDTDEVEFVRRLVKKKCEIYESVSTDHKSKPDHPSTSNLPTPFPFARKKV